MTHLIKRLLIVASAALIPATVLAEPADRSRFENRPEVVTRHFSDIGQAQLHFRRAGKSSQNAPVVLFHQSPNSSQVFVEYMSELAQDRAVFAPDTPGFGESDLPAHQPEIADYAAAMIAFFDAEKLGQVDLVGYHTGAAIAIEIARTHPDRVRRLILIGVPAFTPDEADAFEAQPWPKPFDEKGEAVSQSWQSSLKWRGSGQDDASVRRWFDQKTANGPSSWWGARAALRYQTAVALKEVEAPILFVRPKDDLWESSLRILPSIPSAHRLDLPQYGFGLFEAAPKEMAAHTRAFLKRDEP